MRHSSLVSPLTQNSEEYESISISEAVVISWTLQFADSPIKPHSHANTGMIYLFPLPHLKSGALFFFSSIFNEKIISTLIPKLVTVIHNKEAISSHISCSQFL